MTALEQTGNLPEWVRALSHHGLAMATMGDCALGVAELQRALARAQEMGSVYLICIIQLNLALALTLCGDPLQAIEAARKAAEAAEESGDQILVYLGHGIQAWSEARAGQFEAAGASMARSQAVAQELGGRLVFEDRFLAASAEIALGAGRIQEALDLAERVVATAQAMANPWCEAHALQTWGQALAALEPPRWNEAEVRFAGSLRLFESVLHRTEAARTHLVWGTVCRDRGDLAAARGHWEEAAAEAAEPAIPPLDNTRLP